MKKTILLIIIVLSTMILNHSSIFAENKTLPFGAFEISHKLTLPGTPAVIFDAMTGDISSWWDHSFSMSPKKFFIEAKPGGGFYEIFDDSGDGVKHATVIYADRGKYLRFDGPLGLSGRAIQMVTTYQFEAAGADSTLLQVSVHAAGEMEDGLADTVERVWYHFLFERFKPFIENGMQ